MMYPRSAILVAWLKFCSAIRTVKGCGVVRCLYVLVVRLTVRGASPAVGPSTRGVVAEDMSVRASASICCSPQLMLAVARALMSSPRILLVDEPSVGLAPIL